jgi:hypothetical protein
MMNQKEQHVFTFRFIFPGYLTAVLAMFLLFLYSPNDFACVVSKLQSNDVLIQIFLVSISGFVIGFLEGLVFLPIIDETYDMLRTSILGHKRFEKSQIPTPHKHFISNILGTQMKAVKELGISIGDNIQTDEDAIFDAYLNEKASPLAIDRLFFLSDKRHLYTNSYKITILMILIAFIFLVKSILESSFSISHTVAVFGVLFFLILTFRHLADEVLKKLRNYEMTLLASNYEELTRFVTLTLEGIVADSTITEEERIKNDESTIRKEEIK